MEFKIKNLSIDVLLKDVHYCGKCKFVVELDKTKVFPCITRVFITLMERPKVGGGLMFFFETNCFLFWFRNEKIS